MTANNRYEFRIFAAKRSGHHAVLHWLFSHFDGPGLFLNNCEFCDETNFVWEMRQQNTLVRYRGFAGTSSHYYDRGERLGRYDHTSHDPEAPDRYASRRQRMEALVAAEEEIRGRVGAPTTRDFYAYNFEDLDLGHVDLIPADLTARGQSERVHDILILRDPRNWLASRLRGFGSVSEPVLAAYKSHLLEALGKKSRLPGVIVVSYNQWFQDDAYRRQIAEQLGLSPTDRGLTAVQDFGGGSSFDGRSYDGHGSAMGVLSRWEALAEEPAFVSLLERDPELIELGDELFGKPPFA